MGLVQKQNEKMEAFQSLLDDQQQRSMKENIIIHNYDDYEIAESNYRPIAVKFFTEVMGMTDMEPREVYVAHKVSENSNAIIAKVSYPLKEEIMQRRGTLENKKNSANVDIFVTEQTPEAVRARRKDLRSEADKYHKLNQNKPDGEKVSVKIRNNRLYVAGAHIPNPIPPPEPKDILGINEEEREELEKCDFFATEVQGEKNSKFQGFGLKVNNVREVRKGYRALKWRYPHATHIMSAYRICNSEGKLETAKQDDGEINGSQKILEALNAIPIDGLAVFVSRQYGGQHIGRNRFNHIKQCAEAVIDEFKES